MISGWRPVPAIALMRARIGRLCFFAYSSEHTIVAEAPSVSGEAVPAVTVPSAKKAGFRPESTSIVVSGRIPPSALTTPFLVSIGTISSLNLPASRALAAF
jgi:hypothetical protein